MGWQLMGSIETYGFAQVIDVGSRQLVVQFLSDFCQISWAIPDAALGSECLYCQWKIGSNMSCWKCDARCVGRSSLTLMLSYFQHVTDLSCCSKSFNDCQVITALSKLTSSGAEIKTML
ncbi:hypothetical protein H6P81_009090 [Aristolochia fimbriata]|uniref:Uncharacterized protein n=1 Tax=Aristolochia fimbriata TaxID=158543 RepID=A0AAV7EM13_ARIFI|nr:hypothetical protein H6P81_009090 [Aristolochia fimbriata]